MFTLIQVNTTIKYLAMQASMAGKYCCLNKDRLFS